MTPAVVPGAVVWLALATGTLGWLGIAALSAGRLAGPRRALRAFLGSWPPRIMILAAWAAAGWHVFCQRP